MTTVEYPDVAHYQAGLSLAGAPLVFAKATQGSGYTDPEYADFRAQAKQRKIPQGAYHWLDTSDAIKQARHCFSVVGHGVPLMVDEEQPTISVGHTIAFVTEYRRIGGLVPLEYLPRWTWEASGKPDLRPLAKAGLLLVASDYVPADSITLAGKAWQAYGGVAPTIVQYTSKHLFNGQLVDFNRFPGSLDMLLGLLQLGDDMANLTDLNITHLEGVAARTEALLKLLPKSTMAGTGKTLDADLPAVDALIHIRETVDQIAKSAGVAPTQDQVDAAMAKALSDPTVIASLGAAIASHLKVV